MSIEVCRICNRAVFFQAETDHVGRQTSKGKWVHYDQDITDHEADGSFSS